MNQPQDTVEGVSSPNSHGPRHDRALGHGRRQRRHSNHDMVREGRRRIPARSCSLQRTRHTLPRMLCTPSRRRHCARGHCTRKTTDGGGRTTAHKRGTCVQQSGGRGRPRPAAACPHEPGARDARHCDGQAQITCEVVQSLSLQSTSKYHLSVGLSFLFFSCAEVKLKGGKEGSRWANKNSSDQCPILTSPIRPLGCLLVCVRLTTPCGRACLRW